MSTYIILNAYLQYFKNLYNRPAQLEMVYQRNRISQESNRNRLTNWPTAKPKPKTDLSLHSLKKFTFLILIKFNFKFTSSLN